MDLIFKKWLNKEGTCKWNEYYAKNSCNSKNDGKSEYCHYSTYLEQENCSLFLAGMTFWSLKKCYNIYLASAVRVALDDYCSRRLRSQRGGGIAAGLQPAEELQVAFRGHLEDIS